MRPEQLKAAQCYVIEPMKMFESERAPFTGDYLLKSNQKAFAGQNHTADGYSEFADCYDDRNLIGKPKEKIMYGKAKRKRRIRSDTKRRRRFLLPR